MESMTTPTSSTPTNVSQVKGRFVVEPLDHTGSPVDGSRTVGRFAVGKESEIQEVIKRNLSTKTTSGSRHSTGSNPISDTLNVLQSQINGLIERNSYLETENQRLNRELLRHKSSDHSQ
jgi:hypothetical protein